MPLIWAPLAASHSLGQALGLRETLHVPFFAETDDAAHGRAALDPEDLLYGILIGYHEAPPLVNMADLRPRLGPMVTALGRGFRFDSTEDVILGVAANLHRDGMPDEARAVLTTGRTLLPHSAPIASDAVMNLWVRTAEAPATERDALWQEIHRVVSGIDYAGVRPDIRQSIAFMHFVAVRCLGDADAIERVLHDEVFEHVEEPSLKVKVKRALEDTDSDPVYLYA